ncbi:MAG TPA: hypothetical protein DCR40_05340 [Prolixibacteraceae bacterium]|nr:hypothetical protein [Prolixibacteraceae bacterium]
MRKFSYILVVIIGYLLLSSKSCDSGQQNSAAMHETELMRDMEDLKNEFESDELTEKSLNAFEIKAKQKLVDLSDYLVIYTAKTIDESFRTQARQMIRDLFASENVRLNGLLLNESDRKGFLINDFLNKKSGYNSIDLKFYSIRISESLHRINEMNYAGRLRFSRFLKAETSTDTLIIEPAKMEVEIFVSKVNKAFGNDTLQIWNVSLGNIH